MRIQIIGGGIVGLSIARSLLLKGYKNVEVLEKESEIAKHQSSRNSGVMHAGFITNLKLKSKAEQRWNSQNERLLQK